MCCVFARCIVHASFSATSCNNATSCKKCMHDVVRCIQGRTGSKIFSGQKRIQGAPSGACLLGSVVGVTTPRPSRQIGEKPTSR